jgi:hypothetical protein
VSQSPNVSTPYEQLAPIAHSCHESPAIDRERLVTMVAACGYLHERIGRRLHVGTLYRWALRGSKGRRLETVLVGRQRYTSIEAINRFMHCGEHVREAVTVVTLRPNQPVYTGANRDVEALKRRVYKERPRRAGA